MNVCWLKQINTRRVMNAMQDTFILSKHSVHTIPSGWMSYFDLRFLDRLPDLKSVYYSTVALILQIYRTTEFSWVIGDNETHILASQANTAFMVKSYYIWLDEMPRVRRVTRSLHAKNLRQFRSQFVGKSPFYTYPTYPSLKRRLKLLSFIRVSQFQNIPFWFGFIFPVLVMHDVVILNANKLQ